MFNFLTDVLIIQGIVCVCVAYLIGRFIHDYFDYLKSHPDTKLMYQDLKAINMNVYRLSKQMAYIITLVKKEDNNGKTEED